MAYSQDQKTHQDDGGCFIDSDTCMVDHDWLRIEELDDNDEDIDQWPVLDVSNQTLLPPSSFPLPTKPPAQPSRQTGSSLSTEDAMRLAGMRVIHMSSSSSSSDTTTPLDLSLSGLSDRDVRNVELTEYLLSSADKVAKRRFDHALGLLGLCDGLASSDGNPVERVVHYFSKALRAKIAKETGTGRNQLRVNDELVVDEKRIFPETTLMAFHETVPFHQIQHIAATQAILDEVARARKIHVIDLKTRIGLQWITLMQALQSRPDYPVESLTITTLAMGSSESIRLTESTGDRLRSYAESINMPFYYNIVRITDLHQFRAGLFQTGPDETLVVYSEFFLDKFIGQPVELEMVMREIKAMMPSLMVVIEIEGSHNSGCFATRFVEMLYHYGAYFDCLGACMGEREAERKVFEWMMLSELITNVLVAEGEERGMRAVKMEVWRAFFGRFGMVESELSDVLLYQVKLVAGGNVRWKPCTTSRDGESLTLGWKGTQMISISTWKFVRVARLVSCGPKDLVVEFS